MQEYDLARFLDHLKQEFGSSDSRSDSRSGRVDFEMPTTAMAMGQSHELLSVPARILASLSQTAGGKFDRRFKKP